MARVLVVDDEEPVRNGIRRSLERAGHAVFEAEDGVAALLCFAAGDFDVVVTDLVMPEKEGVETIGEMLRLRPQAKIIAMSGGGRLGPVDYLAVAKRLGAVSTLAKPFSQQELLDAIEATLPATSR
jgi:two-component system, chemotaxis family, chemotaxis protein CheY